MLLYEIGLSLIPNIGSIRAKYLLDYFGSAEAFFTESEVNLKKAFGLETKIAQSFNKKIILEKAEKEIKFIEKYKIQALFYQDKEYPYRLKQCADAPIMLYYKGNIQFDKQKVVSIVGTRTATEYGKNLTKKIVKELSELDVLIVSGLAYGIDICAHKASLEHNLSTVAVLGHGLQMIYPSEHKNVVMKMLVNGGIITSFTSDTKPDRMNFPARNAIIAGLSDATIVIESKAKGGALITAEIAFSYDRSLFAVPGRVGDKCSEGCNYLIKSNKAELIENSGDVIKSMMWDIPLKKHTAIQYDLFDKLSPEEKIIIEILKTNNDSTIDFICNQSELSSGKIAEALLNLEMSDIIKSLPGKMYSLIG